MSADDRIRDLDTEDGYLPHEALCPTCNLVSHRGLTSCQTCAEVRS